MRSVWLALDDCLHHFFSRSFAVVISLLLLLPYVPLGQIAVAQADAAPLQLTSIALDGAVDFPVYNPNGGTLAYANFWPGGIFTVNDDGTGKTQLSEDGWEPHYSPDGTSIVFYVAGEWPNSDIYKINTDGTGLVNLTSGSPLSEVGPSFSHDGSKILYYTEDWMAGGDLFIMDSDGSNKQNLTNHPGNFGFKPVFSPDDSKILYTRAEPGSQMQDMWIIDVNTHEKTNLTNTPSESEQPTVFSPDGTKIAYATGEWGGPSHHLYTMNIDGSNKQHISSGDGYVCCVYFNSDNSKIFYTVQNTNQETHNPETYKVVMSDADGQNPVVLVEGQGRIGCCIAWSPDKSNFVVAINDELWRYSAAGSPLPPSPDIIAPVTSLEALPSTPNGQNGWYITVPQLKLGADEEASISHSYVSPNGPWTVDSFFDVSIDIDPPPEGQSTLYYFSEDTAGNTEQVQNVPFAVDTGNPTAPTLSWTQTGDDQINLSWTPSDDPVSGFDHYEVFANGENIANTAEANHEVFDLLPGAVYSFFIKAVDGAGNSADSNTEMIELMELNQAPVVNTGGPYIGNEGEVVNFDASGSSDPDGDPLSYRWDFNADGIWDTGFTTDHTASYSWDDDHQGIAALEVTDGSLSDSATATVSIANVPPAADAGEDKTAMWGDEVSFSGSFTDPGILDLQTGSWDFGDASSAVGFDANHIYADPSVYTAALTVLDKDGGLGTDGTTVTVLKRPTTLTYSGETTATQYSDVADLKATLTDDRGLAIADREVNFTLGTQVITALTDPSGIAQAHVKIDQSSGTKDLDLTFEEDSHYLFATSQSKFKVTKEDTSLIYDDEASIISQRGESALFKAELSENDGSVGDLSGKEIIFTIGNESDETTVSGTTDSSGIVEVYASLALQADLYDVSAAFAEDEYYLASETDKSPYVVWEVITGLNINGGGWLMNDGKKSNFGFNAKYQKNADVPSGQLQLVNRASEQNIHSEGFNWLVLTSGGAALLHGSATINGENGHTFTLTVSDNGTPGKGKDEFALYIDTLEVPLNVSGIIEGGNIVIH